jgi:crossover junction endodeoxyribonuclease RuvC
VRLAPGGAASSAGRRLRVAGIDPGSSATGYGVVELVDGRLRHVTSGRIAPGRELPLPSRLKAIYEQVLRLLHDLKPTAVAVESLFFARNVRSALVLAHSRGIVLLAAAEAGLPVSEYAPMEVKRATVGYGRASKEQVQAMVARLLALPARPAADAADALGVAICHAHQAGSSAAWHRCSGGRAR